MKKEGNSSWGAVERRCPSRSTVSARAVAKRRDVATRPILLMYVRARAVVFIFKTAREFEYPRLEEFEDARDVAVVVDRARGARGGVRGEDEGVGVGLLDHVVGLMVDHGERVYARRRDEVDLFNVPEACGGDGIFFTGCPV